MRFWVGRNISTDPWCLPSILGYTWKGTSCCASTPRTTSSCHESAVWLHIWHGSPCGYLLVKQAVVHVCVCCLHEQYHTHCLLSVLVTRCASRDPLLGCQLSTTTAANLAAGLPFLPCGRCWTTRARILPLRPASCMLHNPNPPDVLVSESTLPALIACCAP